MVLGYTGAMYTVPLELKRLTVIGGRVTVVGVGGLILGGELCTKNPFLKQSLNTPTPGGISFFSGHH